jgi:nitrite reductase/ring-hydroxylating ferredoxin subunit
MAFVRVADLEAIGAGELLGVKVEGKAVCLARVDDEVYAFADNCSHRDFPLSSGELEPENCAITCDWHGARFDIRTGEALSLPATRPIRVYPCRIEDGAVYVDVA